MEKNSRLINKYTISYAQNREDIIIDSFFPDVKKGFYIDIGANHPFYHSVTKHFYDKGWRGINFEPNPMLFNQIKDHRPGDKNLRVGLGDKDDLIDFRVYHSKDRLEGISTFSEDMKKSYERTKEPDAENFTDLTVEVTTLRQVLKELKPAHIHFMKVDVEGYEYEVIKGNDWNKYRPELICVESNHIIKDWRPILKTARYRLAFNDGLNDYYLAAESLKRIQFFDYARAFLLSKPVLPFEIYETIRVLEDVVEQTRHAKNELEKALASKQMQVDDLQVYINEITPLRKHMKKSVRDRIKVTKRRIERS